MEISTSLFTGSPLLPHALSILLVEKYFVRQGRHPYSVLLKQTSSTNTQLTTYFLPR